MSKKWYPVIDYVNCAECGACTDQCSHGVYDEKKAPTPIVINGEGCIQGCHGCGNLCPNGAITYVGENTGWTPPNGESSNNEACSCGGSCCWIPNQIYYADEGNLYEMEIWDDNESLETPTVIKDEVGKTFVTE